MEYHSFLLQGGQVFDVGNVYWFPSPYGVSFILIMMVACGVQVPNNPGFRLLTEYHSFLWVYERSKKQTTTKFPSPYGVSFILIIKTYG